MSLCRDDVVSAYSVLLGREPESAEIVAAHMAIASDRLSLAKNIAASSEASNRLRLATPEHEHHLYKGYSASDAAVFDQFVATTAAGTPGFVTSFIGCRYRTAFAKALAPHDGEVEGRPFPVGGRQGETAEYIGTLRSVLDARDGRYRMLECGAGYGTWMAFAYLAAKQRGIGDVHVYGVEGEAGHFAFLQQHMADNEISAFTAFNAAVGVEDGQAEWPIASDPSDVYGGRPLENGSDYHGGQPTRTVSVKVMALPDLLTREPVWDLLHMDIQGGEGELCRACIKEITACVRRVFIGTHSRVLDGEVMSTFHAAGWSLENEKPTISHWRDGAATLETLAVVDGLQVWRNPKL